MKAALSSYVFGPAIALRRYFVSMSVTRRLRALPDALSERHLANLTAYTDRLSMISALTPKGATIAEVGVARGDFSTQLWDAIEPAKLTLIDYWKSGKSAHGIAPGSGTANTKRASDYDVVRLQFADRIAEKRIELIRDWSWNGLAQLEDNSLDLVYIDAAHDYDSVRKDLTAALSKIKPDGVIAGHDYVRWGRFGFRNGVIEAVTEFCVAEGFQIVGLTFERQYPPSYALQRI